MKNRKKQVKLSEQAKRSISEGEEAMASGKPMITLEELLTVHDKEEEEKKTR